MSAAKRKKAETPYKCPRCKNQRTESHCFYCNWKGWEGPGKQLREAAKQQLRESNFEEAKEEAANEE